MTRAELLEISRLLQSLYGTRFPALEPGMASLWLDAFTPLDLDLVRCGVQRWARHHTYKAPSLDELLEQIEFVRDEQARARRAPSTKGFLDVLRDAAQVQAANPERTSDNAIYGHLMTRLAARHLGRWDDEAGQRHDKLTYDGLARQCSDWANAYEAERPMLAGDLLQAAIQYADMAFAAEQAQARTVRASAREGE